MMILFDYFCEEENLRTMVAPSLIVRKGGRGVVFAYIHYILQNSLVGASLVDRLLILVRRKTTQSSAGVGFVFDLSPLNTNTIRAFTFKMRLKSPLPLKRTARSR